MVIVGVPLAWRKVKGGFETDYIGYWIDVRKQRVGLSEAQAQWIADWIARTTATGKVLMGEVHSVLGRMGFGLQALDLLKPFLAPIHAWVAAAPARLVLQIPELIHLVLAFIQEALEQGFRSDPLELGNSSRPAFRANAKWFSERITRHNAPWAFSKGEAFRSIASLELFASLLSVMAFVPHLEEGRESALVLGGDTDNQGNASLSNRMSTRRNSHL